MGAKRRVQEAPSLANSGNECWRAVIVPQNERLWLGKEVKCPVKLATEKRFDIVEMRIVLRHGMAMQRMACLDDEWRNYLSRTKDVE